jgi:hypothetical protein
MKLINALVTKLANGMAVDEARRRVAADVDGSVRNPPPPRGFEDLEAQSRIAGHIGAAAENLLVATPVAGLYGAWLKASNLEAAPDSFTPAQRVKALAGTVGPMVSLLSPAAMVVNAVAHLGFAVEELKDAAAHEKLRTP